MILPTLTLAFGLLVAGCNLSNEVFVSYQHPKKSGWEKGDTLIFELPEVVDGGRCRVNIAIRSNGQYPYRQLWLIVRNDFNRSGSFRNDTIMFELSDEGGSNNGDGLNTFQYSAFLKDVRLKKGATYSARISHCMRQNRIEGITDVGVDVVRR